MGRVPRTRAAAVTLVSLEAAQSKSFEYHVPLSPSWPVRLIEAATRDDFLVGDRVSFEDRHLQTRIGTLVRSNQKTASINCDNEPGWRVPFDLLRHLIDL